MPRLPYRSDPFNIPTDAAGKFADALREGMEMKNKKGESNVTRPIEVETAYDFLDLFKDHISCSCIGAIVSPEEAARCGCAQAANDTVS